MAPTSRPAPPEPWDGLSRLHLSGGKAAQESNLALRLRRPFRTRESNPLRRPSSGEPLRGLLKVMSATPLIKAARGRKRLSNESPLGLYGRRIYEIMRY